MSTIKSSDLHVTRPVIKAAYNNENSIKFGCGGKTSGEKVGTASLLASIYKSEGVRGLFRGNMANVFRVAPSTAFEFTIFDYLKSNIKKVPLLSKLSTETQLFVSGCAAGCLAYALVYPIDVVKTVHSLGLYEGKSVMGTLSALVKEHGIRRCYRGLLATCCGITPYAGIKLASYQLLVDKFRAEGPQSNMQNMAMGALSGYIAVTICYPTDVIRRNYQVSILKDEPTGYLNIFTKLYKKNGFKGFYAGLIPTYWKVLPSVALAFTINDYLKSALLNQRK